MEKIDRKFRILAVNTVNGKIYDESNSLLLCAKDKAVPAALFAYKLECERIGANPEHIRSVELLYNRVKDYHSAIECRVPDTVGAEIPMCLAGDSTSPVSKDETAWLIEKQQNGGAIWYGVNDWTNDPSNVVRFSRKQDAEAVINNWGMTDCIVTEHMWCAE